MMRSSGASSGSGRLRLSVDSSHRVTSSTPGLVAPAEQVADLARADAVAVVGVLEPELLGPAPVAVDDDADVPGDGRAGALERGGQPPLVQAVGEVAQSHARLRSRPRQGPVRRVTGGCRSGHTRARAFACRYVPATAASATRPVEQGEQGGAVEDGPHAGAGVPPRVQDRAAAQGPLPARSRPGRRHPGALLAQPQPQLPRRRPRVVRHAGPQGQQHRGRGRRRRPAGTRRRRAAAGSVAVTARGAAGASARKKPHRSPTSPNGSPSPAGASVTSYGTPSRPRHGTGRTDRTDPSTHITSAMTRSSCPTRARARRERPAGRGPGGAFTEVQGWCRGGAGVGLGLAEALHQGGVLVGDGLRQVVAELPEVLGHQRRLLLPDLGVDR